MASNEKIYNFLNQHNFFNYQNYQKYQAVLDKQIEHKIEHDQGSKIVLPLKLWEQGISAANFTFTALDLGGTFIRIKICKLEGQKVNILKSYKAPFYQQKVYTQSLFFQQIEEHLSLIQDENEELPTKMVFSFANALSPTLKNNNRLDGKIEFWGKNHKQSHLIGINLADELEKYLKQNKYPNIEISAINDSSSAIFAAKNIFPDQKQTIINIIVGSGTNISLGYDTEDSFIINNLEFGDFDFIPYSSFDIFFNKHSSTPNKFRTEKLFTGAWQYQIFTLMLNWAIKEGVIDNSPLFKRLDLMDGAELEIFFNPESKDFPAYEEIKILWQEISKRGAFVCALGVVRSILFLEKRNLINKNTLVFEVGSIIDHCHTFRQTFESYVIELLSNTKNPFSKTPKFHFEKDPTAEGAAFVLKLLAKMA